MKIKKGELNYDQSGRAYPNNSIMKENWDCIWESGGKYYRLAGDNEHKEWKEVNIYNQIINEAYANYLNKATPNTEGIIGSVWFNRATNIEEFLNKCKTDTEFSKRWGLKIDERELTDEERVSAYNNKTVFISKGYIDENGFISDIGREKIEKLIPKKLITLTHDNEIIEIYE